MYNRIIKEAIARNVIIWVYDFKDKFVGMGSGVIVGENKILTVSHILGNVGIPVKVKVFYANVFTTAKVAKIDGGKDGLAMLYTDDDLDYKLVRISPNTMGQEVLIYGNTPPMYDILLVTHLVRQIDKNEMKDRNVVYDKWLTADAKIRTGFSGGGVYTNQGLTGIVWGHITLGEGMQLTIINTPARIIEFSKEFFMPEM